MSRGDLAVELAGARVWRSPRRLLRALALPLAVFLVWDALAISRGTWWFSSVYTTGWSVAGRVPWEEVVFFVVVPLCAVLTFETVRRILHRA